MSASQYQQARVQKSGKKSGLGKTETSQTLYGFEMDVSEFKNIPIGTIPAGTRVLIVRKAGLPKLKGKITKFKGSGVREVQFIRTIIDGSPNALESIPAIKEEAFQPGARARALLKGAETIAEDLKASGGTLDLDAVCGLTHLTRQGIHKQVRAGRLLAVPGPSNRNVYPVAQFRDDGKPIEGLKEVRGALGTESPWMLLNFLINAEPRLNNRKPIDLLRAGKLEAVLEAAHRVGVQGA